MRLLAGIALGALGFALMSNGAAGAQTPAGSGESGPQAPPPADREVVVITGLGPVRTSDELVASSTVLDADAVIERLSGGLGDTLKGLPGISSTSFGPGASRPIIRGLGAERVQVLANGIGVIDASAASPDHAVTSDPLGAERIEILRGPASLAYGGGATGGVINVIDGLIVDRLPTTDFSGAAYGALSSVDEGRQAAVRATGVAGNFVGVISASKTTTDDIDIPGFALTTAERAERIADGADPAGFARGKLPNSATDGRAISAGLSWVGDRAFIGGAVRKLETTYGTVAEETAFIDMEQTRYDVRGGLTFDDGFLKSVTATGSTVDYGHTEFEAPGVPGTEFTSEGWESRIEAQHRELAGFEGSIGAQSSDKDFAAFGEEAIIGPTNTRQDGVFVYEVFDRDNWGLEGGLRYDRITVDNIDFGQRTFEPVNASFGAHVHVGDNWFLGASVAATQRAPTDLELFADGPHIATAQFEVGDAALKIETGVNYELTARWEGEKLNLSGSLYRFDFDRFIYLEDTGAVEPGEESDLPVFAFVQAGASFTGGEATISYDLGDAWGAAWKADGSVDYVRAELDAGGNLPLIPPLTVNAGLEGERGRFNGRVDVQYGARQDKPAAFERETPDYVTVDLRLGFDVTDTIKLMLEARNLTDEEVRVAASPLKEIAPQAGRSVRVALRVEF